MARRLPFGARGRPNDCRRCQSRRVPSWETCPPKVITPCCRAELVTSLQPCSSTAWGAGSSARSCCSTATPLPGSISGPPVSRWHSPRGSPSRWALWLERSWIGSVVDGSQSPRTWPQRSAARYCWRRRSTVVRHQLVHSRGWYSHVLVGVRSTRSCGRVAVAAHVVRPDPWPEVRRNRCGPNAGQRHLPARRGTGHARSCRRGRDQLRPRKRPPLGGRAPGCGRVRARRVRSDAKAIARF